MAKGMIDRLTEVGGGCCGMKMNVETLRWWESQGNHSQYGIW